MKLCFMGELDSNSRQGVLAEEGYWSDRIDGRADKCVVRCGAIRGGVDSGLCLS